MISNVLGANMLICLIVRKLMKKIRVMRLLKGILIKKIKTFPSLEARIQRIKVLITYWIHWNHQKLCNLGLCNRNQL